MSATIENKQDFGRLTNPAGHVILTIPSYPPPPAPPAPTPPPNIIKRKWTPLGLDFTKTCHSLPPLSPLKRSPSPHITPSLRRSAPPKASVAGSGSTARVSFAEPSGASGARPGASCSRAGHRLGPKTAKLKQPHIAFLSSPLGPCVSFCFKVVPVTFHRDTLPKICVCSPRDPLG